MNAVKNRTSCFISVTLVLLAVLLAACAGGSSTPSKFYLLNPMPGSEAGVFTEAKADDVSVLVGPITLPAYLNRTQIVTLAGPNELALDEFSRWAEPLQDNFYRVLVENISLLLNTPRVYAYDRRGMTLTDFQIVVDVTRFERSAQGDAFLTAFWSVAAKDRKLPSIERKSVFREAAPSAGPTGVLDAQNRMLTEFSREIAGAIRSLKR